jgi:antitoxin Phd
MATKNPGSHAATRNDVPALGDLPSLSSTQVQNRFGGVLDELRKSGAILIERHERPAAVLMSIEDFAHLSARAQPGPQLRALTAEFDALVARMQSPEGSAGLAQAFAAAPAELAAAAAPLIRASRASAGEMGDALVAVTEASRASPVTSAPRPRSKGRRGKHA